MSQVTQDGYLKRPTTDDTLDDEEETDIDLDGSNITSRIRSASSIFLPRSLHTFSSSPLFIHQQRQSHSSNSPDSFLLGTPGVTVVDPTDNVIILPDEEVGEPSFGAGEAAEDTATLYAEFQILPHQSLYKTAFDGKADGEWVNGCLSQIFFILLIITDRGR